MLEKCDGKAQKRMNGMWEWKKLNCIFCCCLMIMVIMWMNEMMALTEEADFNMEMNRELEEEGRRTERRCEDWEWENGLKQEVGQQHTKLTNGPPSPPTTHTAMNGDGGLEDDDVAKMVGPCRCVSVVPPLAPTLGTRAAVVYIYDVEGIFEGIWPPKVNGIEEVGKWMGMKLAAFGILAFGSCGTNRERKWWVI